MRNASPVYRSIGRCKIGIFQGDVIIKAMVDLGLDEMRKNPWLLDHAFESLKGIPYISDKYGQSNIDAAKEWFANNQIDVYLRPRNDKDRMPCVTIFPGPSDEKPEMKHMGDASTQATILQPNEIGKSIPFVVKPFSPEGYSPATGEVFFKPGLAGLQAVSPGMVLVDPSTGTGYPILNVEADAFVIQSDLDIQATQLAVIPQFPYFKANIEHTFCQETYTVGVYAHGDPQTLVWLHTIVLYAMYRYREVLLEGNGFAESIIRSGEILEDPDYSGPNGESAYARLINVTGQVENSWIKAPKRFIETIVPAPITVMTDSPTPEIIDTENEVWYTDDPDGSSEDQGE